MLANLLLKKSAILYRYVRLKDAWFLFTRKLDSAHQTK